MCLAIPGRILSIDKTWAEVDVMGILSKVNVQLIDNPKVDDSILIHAGCAIQKISVEYSLYLQDVLTEFIIEDEKNG
ncbi:MAG: HypC/HybG/HupF family hydrogenase formation chaperone [Clostridiaceae bacterium]|nr:HypC/HybG/HupF family hydrogenase formation chaperone [Clostridiaceae bacterium]